MKFFDLCNFDQGGWTPKGHALIRPTGLLQANSKSARCIMPEFQPVSSALVSAIERPSCPKCRHHRMLLARLGAGPSGFASRTFECQKCGYVSTTDIPADPMTSDAQGWLTSELRPPT